MTAAIAASAAVLVACERAAQTPTDARPIDDAAPAPAATGLQIGWFINVGVGGAGDLDRGSLAAGVWDEDRGDWRDELPDRYAEVVARIGDRIDFVHFHHPHGIGPWYDWRPGQATRMRFEGRVINPHTADLDGLVALFPFRPAFYFGSPRCSEMDWSGFDPDPTHCEDPQRYLGEALSHDPLYVALDALQAQTVEGGPWLAVERAIREHGTPALVEANVPKGRSDMQDAGLWATYRGWQGYGDDPGWRAADWTKPVEAFAEDEPVLMDLSHAPRELKPQGSPEAIRWRWRAAFEARDTTNLDMITIPWHLLASNGRSIEDLARYLGGDDSVRSP